MKYFVVYATIIIVAALVLGGCSSTETVNKISVTSDSFCRVAKKITFSIDDTQLTVDQVRRHNARVDTCAKEAKAVS